MKKLIIISSIILLLLLLWGCENTLPISELNEASNTKAQDETIKVISESTENETKAEEEPATKPLENSMPYKIVLDKHNYCINILSKDDNGDYTILSKSFPMSIKEGLETLIGEYTIGEKHRWSELNEKYVQYSTNINNDIIIHSPCYLAKDINTLVRESYNSIGKTISEGSILTTTEAAYWIFENCDSGTIVEIAGASSFSEGIKSVLPELNPEKFYTDPTDPLWNSEKENELPYYIYVEKGSFAITVYTMDDTGEYTYPVRSFPTALGRTPGRTPTGKSKILKKERWHDFWSNGGSAQFISAFHEKIYIHSAVYSLKDNNTLLPKLYNEIGTPATAGCLRTTTEAAYIGYIHTVQLVQLLKL